MKQFLRTLSSYRSTVMLLSLSAFCAALTVCRMALTKGTALAFMLWNLFLAFVPWLVASVAYIRGFAHKAALVCALLVWLLFFPNAPYILTDLIHVGKFGPVPEWFDLTMLASYALAGLLYGFTSLQMAEEVMRSRLGIKHTALLSVALLYLASFGIYLGRFLRWNSWDILGNPAGLMRDVLERLVFPLRHKTAWAFTLVFGTMLNLLYPFFRRNELSRPVTH